MTASTRVVGVLGIALILLTSTAIVIAVPRSTTDRGGTALSPVVEFSGVTGYVYANTNYYSNTAPLSGATVTIVDDCVSLESMSCTTVAILATNASGFFGTNLAAGAGYYAIVTPDPTPGPLAPNGFGGAVDRFTAPDASPLTINVYPMVPYGNATIVLPGYNCLAADVDNYADQGPGCENPVLSWTQDGAFYLNTTNELVFYSFVNHTVDPVCPWRPLYQGFPDYSMIPTELLITQDGAYIYSWGAFNSSSANVTVEAVNVTTHRVFLYNYSGVTTSDVVSNGVVELTGWDGNDSQAVLILENGEVLDHDLWGSGTSYIGTLPFFEANNIYWIPELNAFINVEADGNTGDYVEELQLTGPAASSAAFALSQTYLGQWTTAGIVVNGVNGVSFNVSSRQLSVQPENSGLVYSVLPDGTLSTLLTVTNLDPDGACGCIPIGSSSESDRPLLIASGPQLSHNYNGSVNNSWLTSMTPGHIGFYSSNESPWVYNPHASFGTAYSWSQWYQDGQFVNASYIISAESYDCSGFSPGSCTINGGDGAAVGTIWWLWKLGLPEFPYPATNPIADAMAPAPTVVTSIAPATTSATVTWAPPGNDAILNYTVTWSPVTGGSPHYLSVPGSERTFTITGLAPSAAYDVAVYAWNLHWHGSSGGLSTFTTVPEASDLAVTGAGIANVSLDWSNPPAGTFTNLTVEYGTTPGVWTGRASVGEVTSYDVTGLRPSTRYYFVILAWNGTTKGGPSNVVNAMTSFEGATDLAVTAVSVTNASLAWTNPAAGAFTNVTIIYGTSPEALSLHASVGTVAAYVVSGLRPSTEYYFEAIAWNGTVEGSVSNIAHATTTFEGAADLIATGTTETNVSLAWLNPPAGTFTNLTLEYGTAPGTLPERLSVGTSSAYLVTGLTSSTTYYFEVVAWNDTIQGLPSNLLSAKTLSPPSSGSNAIGSLELDVLILAVVVLAVAVVVLVVMRSRKGGSPPAPSKPWEEGPSGTATQPPGGRPPPT